MTLLYRIERHLRRVGTSPTTFGREAANDSNLVFDLRCGRECRSALTRQVDAHIAAVEKRAGDAKCRRR